MTFLTELALRRRSVTVMAMVLLLVAGVFSYNQLRQELFPEISFSIVYVVTTYQQGDPSTVANDVTSKVEDLIIGMSDLEKTTSISTGNLSLVTANFIPGADVDDAEEEIRSRVNGLTLPDNASDPFVLRLSSDIFPVMLLTVSGNQDIPSLRRITDDEIIPRLEAVNGVYEVRVEGGVPERVSVIVDPARTNEHNLTIQDVVNAVSGNAIDLNAGTLNNDERSIGLRAYQGYGNLDSIRDLPVGYTRESANPAAPGSTVTPVLLSDVATVTIDTPESETVSRTNGQPSLSLEVLRLPEGNTIELAQELLAVIDDLDLPPGVQVDVLYNDGPALEEQLANVVGQGGLGFIIAVSAIFLFLLQIRPTVIRGILNTPASHPDHRHLDTAERDDHGFGHGRVRLVAEFHESGRFGNRRRSDRGRQHRGPGEHLSTHPGRFATIAHQRHRNRSLPVGSIGRQPHVWPRPYAAPGRWVRLSSRQPLPP